MPSDCDTLGDLTRLPKVITTVLEHQTCGFHCYFLPLSLSPPESNAGAQGSRA